MPTMKMFIFLAALALPAAAMAADVTIDSTVKVERVIKAADGTTKIALQEPKVVTPGEKVVFTLSYKNTGSMPASDFTITNPIPASVEFVSADSAADATYSVDGGKTFAKMPALKVKGANGIRAAGPADITVVRWVLSKPIPAGANGQVSFRGVVR
jgi:uncharacterized repeat protein (TIGR01451 family)